MGTIYLLLRRPTHRLWGQYIYYIVGPPIAYWDNSFTRLSAHPLAMLTIYLLHSRPTHRLWGPYIVGPPILYDYNIYVGRRPLAHLRCNIVRVGLSIFYGLSHQTHCLYVIDKISHDKFRPFSASPTKPFSLLSFICYLYPFSRLNYYSVTPTFSLIPFPLFRSHFIPIPMTTLYYTLHMIPRPVFKKY